jgi:NAD(P)-dependent dehydrogenase (short-subunit alcohol dehydrogenase family)
MRFAGWTAVVTGGGQGIGAAVAQTLAKEGAFVVIAARNAERIKAVADAIEQAGGKARAVHCDVTDPSSVRALASAASRHGSGVDILINNAGAAHSAPLHKITLDDWNRMLAVNATGTFLCTQVFVPGMLERKRGSVVNVASIAGLAGARYIAAYAAAKHAVIGFTRSVAAELEGTGVTCNAVCPGYVDTEMTKESVARVAQRTGKSVDDALAAMLAASGQTRLITPEEVAQAVLKLCNPSGKRANGAALKLVP